MSFYSYKLNCPNENHRVPPSHLFMTIFHARLVAIDMVIYLLLVNSVLQTITRALSRRFKFKKKGESDLT